MKRLILIALLPFALSLWSVAIAAGGSGNWHSTVNNAPWAGGVVPTAADAVTIGNGFTVHCEAGTTCDFLTLTTAGTGNVMVDTGSPGGTLTNHCTGAPCITLAGTGGIEAQSGATVNFGNPAAGTLEIDGVFGAGTFFKMDNGSTFNWTGTVQGTHANIYLDGHSLCSPSAAGVYQQIQAGGSGTVAGILEIVGPNWTSPAVFETKAGQDTNCGIGENGIHGPLTFTTNYAIFNRCGGGTAATSNCIKFIHGGDSPSFSITNTLFNNWYGIILQTNAGVSAPASTWTWNAVDFRNLNYRTGSGQTSLTSLNTTVPNPIRALTNTTCYQGDRTSQTDYLWFLISNMHLGLSKAQGDASDTPGWIGYQCSIATNAAVNDYIVNGYFGTDSTQTAPQPTQMVPYYNTNQLIADNLFYTHAQHAVNISFGSTDTGAGVNTIKGNIFDNDFITAGGQASTTVFVSLANKPFTMLNNITINGDADSPQTGQSLNAILDHATQYQTAGIYMGDTNTTITPFSSYQYNLVDHPTVFGNGVNCQASQGTFSGLTGNLTVGGQIGMNTSAVWNNNGYYNLWNGGDPGSSTCTPVLSNGYGTSIGGVGVWINVNLNIRGTITGKTITTLTAGTPPSYTLVCTGCTGTTAFNQSFTNTLGNDLGVQVGDNVFDNTTGGLGIVTSVTNGTTLVFNLVSGTISNGDTFRILKTYYIPYAAYGSTSYFGNADIHAPMNWFNPGGGVCDWYNQATGAGLSGCDTNPSPGNANILAISRAMVTINGWDYGASTSTSLAGTNCTANCPQRVTPTTLTPLQGVLAIRQMYRPYNGMYANTDCRTSPCQWAGATDGFNAAVLQ